MSLRTCYVQTVRSFSKAFLYLGCKKVTVKGLDKFLDLLTDLEARNVPFENQIGNGNGNGNGENQNGKGIEGNAKPPRGVLTCECNEFDLGNLQSSTGRRQAESGAKLPLEGLLAGRVRKSR